MSTSIFEVGNNEALTDLAALSTGKKRRGVVLTPIRIAGERGGWVHLKEDIQRFWPFYPPITCTVMAMKLAAMGFRNIEIQENDHD
jgi:hypothetical protein